MRKNYFLLLTGCLFLATMTGWAQQAADAERCTERKGSAPVSLSQVTMNGSVNKGGPGVLPSLSALFDIQFTLNLDSAINGASGYAGICWTGTEFWISKWNKDSIFTLSPTGALTASFKIPGVGSSPTSGVRAMTFDGTFIYASDNTAFLHKIDPATKTLVSSTAASTFFNLRSLAYDPTANSGAGGFWVSNFNTDINLIDLNGNVLSTIPVATHTLGGIYGMAFDNITAGGPYLWAFNQGPPTNCSLVRLQLPSGIPTFINHDVNADVGPASGGNTGIAGGTFIGTGFVAGVPSLMGVIQGTPFDILFSYELNDAIQLADDAAIDSAFWEPSYTVIPLDQKGAGFTFPTKVSNKGANQIGTATLQVEVNQGATNIYTGTGSASNLVSGSSALITPGTAWVPTATGTYDVFSSVTIAGVTDLDPSNDTLGFQLEVSDTVFARDNGDISGSLGIGNGTGGTLGQYFTLAGADRISSASFVLNGPTLGDSTKVVVYNTLGGFPLNQIGKSATYVFTTNDTGGVSLTLPITDLAGNPLNVAAGTYFLGLDEYSANVTLATSTYNWRPGVTAVTFVNQPWAPNEDFGFQRVYVLRMNLGSSSQGIAEVSNNTSLTLMPNPAANNVTIISAVKISGIRLLDVSGKASIVKQMDGQENEVRLNLDGLTSGIYMVQVEGVDGKSYYSRLVKN